MHTYIYITSSHETTKQSLTHRGKYRNIDRELGTVIHKNIISVELFLSHLCNLISRDSDIPM